MTNSEFISAVNEELDDVASTGVHQRGDQFAIWFASAILGYEIDDVKDRFHIGGSGDHKLDLGIIDDDEPELISIVQCKFSENPETTTFDTDLPEEIVNAKHRLVKFAGHGSNKRKQFAVRYNALIDEEIPDKMAIAVFGRLSDDAREYARLHDVEIYDFERLKDLYEINQQLAEGDAPASLTLTVKFDGEVIKRESKEPKAREWISVVNALEIYEAVKRYKHGLFEKNLRYKLTQNANKAIATKIRTTLLTQPDALLLFNNGLTFVSTQVTSGNGKLNLSHPQIVNGCQTSWAIFETFFEMTPSVRASHPRAELLVKVIEIGSNQDVLEKIAQSTNQQNAISDRDLRANDASQREIRESFNRLTPPIYYENKEGGSGALASEARNKFLISTGKKGKRPMRAINNTLAAQLYLAHLGLPSYSKQNKKLIYSSQLYVPIYGVAQDDTARFETLEEKLRPTERVSAGADGFRDDVIFAFACYQLADALKALYESRLQRYQELKTLTATQQQAQSYLQKVGPYYKFWQYLVTACISVVVQQWSLRRHESLQAIRQAVIGTNQDPFFLALKTRREFFKEEDNLDHNFVIAEFAPSDQYPMFAKWTRAIALKLEDEVIKQAGDPHSSEWDATFRMQGFIDQRHQTFSTLKTWIIGKYNSGAKVWAESFPLSSD